MTRSAPIVSLFGLMLGIACSHGSTPPASDEGSSTSTGSDDSTNGGTASSGGCASDADCRTFSDYCTGCDCRALLTTEPDPVCSGPGVRCFADPCMQHTAACDAATHTCVLQ